MIHQDARRRGSYDDRAGMSWPRVEYKRGWAYARFTHETADHRIALGTKDPGEAQKRAEQEYAAALSGRRRPLIVAGRASRPLLEFDELLAEWIADQEGVLDETTCANAHDLRQALPRIPHVA
jgi:hypothetical protein